MEGNKRCCIDGGFIEWFACQHLERSIFATPYLVVSSQVAMEISLNALRMLPSVVTSDNPSLRSPVPVHIEVSNIVVR